MDDNLIAQVLDVKLNEPTQEERIYKCLKKDALSKYEDTKELKELIDEAFKTKKYSSLCVLCSSPSSLDQLDNFKEEFAYPSLEEELALIKTPVLFKYIGISSFSITLNFSMEFKDTSKSEYWKLNFEKFEVIVTIRSDNSCLIRSTTAHPHIYGTTLLPFTFNKLSDVTKIMGYLSTYNPDNLQVPLQNFIGLKCSVTGLYTYGNHISCYKTGDIIHRDVAVQLNGHYYSPNVIKKCFTCSKDSPDWIRENGNFICGECNDKR